jgi:hypothetical protein
VNLHDISAIEVSETVTPARLVRLVNAINCLCAAVIYQPISLLA